MTYPTNTAIVVPLESYGQVAAMSAPPVVVEALELEDVLPSAGPGRGRGRANPKAD